ncbi:cytochrome c peroxidase [Nemorincola caseinilytica]|uniref:Cytochrome c peroxidase n=1 Tax=Nemorincola caseinilytica TaxID=2054315 RepID=A0ABP8N3K8_9BACT
MRKAIAICICALVMASVWIAGCKKETIDPGTWQLVSFTVPKGWPQPAYTFDGNKLTYDGFVLGRKLFYDVRLSRDSSISCGSCHQQFASFANLGHDVSHGVANKVGIRNSPGLANMAWHTSFFWDGGVNHLENQPINPIQNPVEMDLPMADVVTRVKMAADYKEMFIRAFGDELVNSQRIFKAMAQFMGTMVSDDSKYDKYSRGEAGGTFTEQELRGLELVRRNCATCHKEPLFSDFSFRNNGLSPVIGVNDSGRAHITHDAADLYKFKVPSLRDVAVTAPYMHDGRIKTLEDVVEHYRTGVAASPTTDAAVAGGINMTDQDKKDIVSFLKTLTDSTFISSKLFAEPAK